MKPLTRMVLGGALLLLMACAGCTDEPTLPPEPLDLPDWEVCLQDYSGDVHQLMDAVDRGEEAALICELALTGWREPDERTFELLYRLYRIRGREPEGLDALVRDMDRQAVAARLRTLHRFSAELEEFEHGWWVCPHYDPVARDLILRARPSEDGDCLPRRWLFWG